MAAARISSNFTEIVCTRFVSGHAPVKFFMMYPINASSFPRYPALAGACTGIVAHGRGGGNGEEVSEGMELIVRGEAKESAALVLELHGRRSGPTLAVSAPEDITAAAQAMCDMRREAPARFAKQCSGPEAV